MLSPRRGRLDDSFRGGDNRELAGSVNTAALVGGYLGVNPSPPDGVLTPLAGPEGLGASAR